MVAFARGASPWRMRTPSGSPDAEHRVRVSFNRLYPSHSSKHTIRHGIMIPGLETLILDSCSRPYSLRYLEYFQREVEEDGDAEGDDDPSATTDCHRSIAPDSNRLQMIALSEGEYCSGESSANPNRSKGRLWLELQQRNPTESKRGFIANVNKRRQEIDLTSNAPQDLATIFEEAKDRSIGLQDWGCRVLIWLSRVDIHWLKPPSESSVPKPATPQWLLLGSNRAINPNRTGNRPSNPQTHPPHNIGTDRREVTLRRHRSQQHLPSPTLQ